MHVRCRPTTLKHCLYMAVLIQMLQALSVDEHISCMRLLMYNGIPFDYAHILCFTNLPCSLKVINKAKMSNETESNTVCRIQPQTLCTQLIPIGTTYRDPKEQNQLNRSYNQQSTQFMDYLYCIHNLAPTTCFGVSDHPQISLESTVLKATHSFRTHLT